MATCQACGIEVDALYHKRNDGLCEHCAPTSGIVPHSATRAAEVLRTQVWTYTPQRELEQLVLDEPRAAVTVDGELLSPWFVCPTGVRDSYIGVVFAREEPSRELLNEVAAQARVRFADEPWNK